MPYDPQKLAEKYKLASHKLYVIQYMAALPPILA